MFDSVDRDPIVELGDNEWSELRNILKNESRCRATFYETTVDPLRIDGIWQPKLIPNEMWSEAEIALLLKATLIKPTIYETGCTTFYPSCRVYHLSDSFIGSDEPTIIATDLLSDDLNRVTPWVDEAETLIECIDFDSFPSGANILMLHSAHNAIGINIGRRCSSYNIVCSDRNPRSHAFVMFNEKINFGSRVTGFDHTSDEILANTTRKYDVIIATPPFAIQPPGEVEQEFKHSSGGPFGTMHLEAVLEVGKRCLRENGRLYSLAYDLGASRKYKEGSTRITAMLESFGMNLSVHTLRNKKVWRIGENKRFSNPMPIRYAISRLADPTYLARDRASFEVWEDWLEEELIQRHDYKFLHYIAVEIQHQKNESVLSS